MKRLTPPGNAIRHRVRHNRGNFVRKAAPVIIKRLGHISSGDTSMKIRGIIQFVCLLGLAGMGGAAPAPVVARLLPALDDRPLLQIDPGGPSAAVTALAFSPDGDTL